MPPRLLRKSYGILATQHTPEIQFHPVSAIGTWGYARRGEAYPDIAELPRFVNDESNRLVEKKRIAISADSESTSSKCVFSPILRLFDTYSLSQCVDSLIIVSNSSSEFDSDLKKAALESLADRMLYLLANDLGFSPVVSRQALLHSLLLYPHCDKLVPVCLKILPLIESIWSDKALVKRLTTVTDDLNERITPSMKQLLAINCDDSIPNLCNMLKLQIYYFPRNCEISVNLKKLYSHVIEFSPAIRSLISFALTQRVEEESEWISLLNRLVSKSPQNLANLMAKLGGVRNFNSPKIYRQVTDSLGKKSVSLSDKLLICSAFKLCLTGAPAGSPRALAHTAALGVMSEAVSTMSTPEEISLFFKIVAEQDYPISPNLWLEAEVHEGGVVDMVRFLHSVYQSKNCPETIKFKILKNLNFEILMKLREEDLDLNREMIDMLLSREEMNRFRNEIVELFLGKNVGKKIPLNECISVLELADKAYSTKLFNLLHVDEESINCLRNDELGILIQTAKFENSNFDGLIKFSMEEIDLEKLDIYHIHRIGEHLDDKNHLFRDKWMSRASKLVLPGEAATTDLGELKKQIGRKINWIEQIGVKRDTHSKAAIGIFFASIIGVSPNFFWGN